jgi:RNA polymerase sigma-70 factor (ECF subfamily)
MALEADNQLMLRVRDGDDESFAVLLQRFRVPVWQFLHRMVHDQAVAEELAQEVFLRVYRSRATYEPSAKFTTWLYRIATHLALNHLRDSKHDRLHVRADSAEEDRAPVQLVSPEASAEQKMLAEDRSRRIRQAIDSLPEKQRLAVILHKYQELDYKQIAELLESSESSVKSLLFRAYETLRARLMDLAPANASKTGG